MQTNTSVIMLDTSLIIPNKYQPRKVFDEESLDTLANSIKTYGIINPILVRQKDDKYEIIAGERRFRAAKKIGLSQVPVIIKNANEQQTAELALIENIQRKGLSSIEEAKSYEEIMRIGDQTQASLAQKIGKSQSSIANKIRLLSLPQEVQDALSNNQISERHARSLLSISDKERQLEVLERIITEKLTVKETEQLINSKEINEEEIKKAISDIMKSLKIEEDEKEEDNMNDGNFFPNYDNFNAATNNASLNTMNMQSMNQVPNTQDAFTPMPNQFIENQQNYMMPAQEQPVAEQYTSMPTQNFGFNEPMTQEANNLITPAMTQPSPVVEMPLFNPEVTMPAEQQMFTQPMMEQTFAPASTPVMDEPLFNPNAMMPIQEQPSPMNIPEISNQFEVPVQPVYTEPYTQDRLSQLIDLLNNNGYMYTQYSNETNHCVIIEIPKN